MITRRKFATYLTAIAALSLVPKFLQGAKENNKRINLLPLGRPTLNNRIYSTEVWQKALKEFNPTTCCRLYHGRDFFPKPEISQWRGTVFDIRIDQNFLTGRVEGFIDTEKYQILPVGEGTLSEPNTQGLLYVMDYKLTAFNFVPKTEIDYGFTNC